MSDEISDFKARIVKPHRRITPCFMTGKGCVYTEQIDREIDHRRAKSLSSAFMILPFQPNVSVFYDLCLRRYICGSYGSLDVVRASQVRRTGYVICEKICKKIQESDFIIADISVPNANVFYELGLAYGIGQKIIVVHHRGSVFGTHIASDFREAGCKAFAYLDLEPLTVEQFPLSNYIWQRENSPSFKSVPTTLLFDPLDFPDYSLTDPQVKSVGQESLQKLDDISLSFATHIKAVVGVAIDNILDHRIKADESIKIPATYYPLIRELKTAEQVRQKSFREILEKVDQSFCAIIRTGGENHSNPMMYFWLGYCHAQGKNVIPITIIEQKMGDVDDLAFDIRALWHMTFVKGSPSDLESELEDTLYQMITSDFTEWSRSRFWNELLEKRGKISIFTGALHNKPLGREMIGDWDLRAASELTSYFASHEYRATIESPVYQIEQVVDSQKAVDQPEYIHELEELLSEKNCVVIASPDVNPLTEIVLGQIYGIPQSNWFDSQFDVEGIPNTVVAFKQIKDAGNDLASAAMVRRTFYRETAFSGEGKPKRGFKAPFLYNHQISGGFVSQTESSGKFDVHAHLVIARNPYAQREQKYIVILNGVSGPATFALTHVLTGGVSKEFVSYDSDFDPNSKSEEILKQILEDLNEIRVGRRRVIQYIIKVTVGPPKEDAAQAQGPNRNIFDWRRICRWELEKDTNSF